MKKDKIENIHKNQKKSKNQRIEFSAFSAVLSVLSVLSVFARNRLPHVFAVRHNTQHHHHPPSLLFSGPRCGDSTRQVGRGMRVTCGGWIWADVFFFLPCVRGVCVNGLGSGCDVICWLFMLVFACNTHHGVQPECARKVGWVDCL